ncbi:hypothetical protein [Pedobacter hartonius]|uniref:DUF1640 domain-containing protein n=1 Tax=Pedobacter hartonius TaxID=425514 RepID=A0A1H3XJM7_9SPHI|nr:hypothetical protein [Pedobacter hartonius]SDZ98758.1 hypothetical protein SAMN05443550_101616 [Pedobacter hartonius]
MTTQALNLYEVLKNRLNDASAKAVVTYLKECMKAMVAKETDTKISHLATKEDLVIVNTKITSIKEDLIILETKLTKMILETKTELMKWTFIFIMGQTAVIAGLIKLFLQQ